MEVVGLKSRRRELVRGSIIDLEEAVSGIHIECYWSVTEEMAGVCPEQGW